jgi:hypothetical protein
MKFKPRTNTRDYSVYEDRVIEEIDRRRRREQRRAARRLKPRGGDWMRGDVGQKP